MTRKRRTFDIRKVNIADVQFDENQVPVAVKYTLESVSECRAFRMYGDTLPSREEGGHPILHDWIGVDFKPRTDALTHEPLLSETAQYYMAEAILRQGLLVDGELYVRCIRSASQVRTGEATFVRASLNRDEVRRRLSYGAHFGKRNERKDGRLYNSTLSPDAKVENLAKMEARYGLASSSSLDTGLRLGRDLTFTLKEDAKNTITTEVYRKGVMEMEITPADGQGSIRPSAAVTVMERLEAVPKKVADRLRETVAKVGFLDAAMDADFCQLWRKYMTSSIQKRCAGIKGLMGVYPHDEIHGEKVDLVITESQWKYTHSPEEEPPLEVCAWQKSPKSPYARLNYQFIQALSITSEELISLAHTALKRVEDTVLSKPASAMAFLGLIRSDQDEDGERYEASLVSTLTRVLDANPSMLHDYYVQRSLRRLLEKYVREMRMGRIPVEGEYRYLYCDPTIMFGYKQGVLRKGEYWVPGRTGPLAAFRSPLIHRSEVAKLNAISEETLRERLTEFAQDTGRDAAWAEKLLAAWRLLFDGCVVFNAHDDILMRMGGADTDGDRVLVTADGTLLRHIPGGPLLVTDPVEGTFQEITWDNLVAYDLTTISGDKIGAITNLATTKVDLALCEVERLIHMEPAKAQEEPLVLHLGEATVADEEECPF